MDLQKTGRLIKRKREELNLTQEQLAEKLFVTKQAVSLWENGRRFPDPDAQLMIYKVLGFNPVELITGLEMYDEDLKKGIAGYLNRIDEKVFVAGMVTDENDLEEYLDLSEYEIFVPGENGKGRLVPYTEYYNVDKHSSGFDNDNSSRETKYDPGKVYLNHGSFFMVIPVELLTVMGKPRYFNIYWNPERISLTIAFHDKVTDDTLDIPEQVYNGEWKGLRIISDTFGISILKMMGIRRREVLLEITPFIHEGEPVIELLLDEAKRSGAEFASSNFMLPQQQYEELRDDEDDEIE